MKIEMKKSTSHPMLITGLALLVLIAAIALGQGEPYPSPPQDILLEVRSSDTNRYVLQLTGGMQLVDVQGGNQVVWDADSEDVKARYQELLKGGFRFTHGSQVYLFGGKDLRRQLLSKAVGGF